MSEIQANHIASPEIGIADGPVVPLHDQGPEIRAYQPSDLTNTASTDGGAFADLSLAYQQAIDRQVWGYTPDPYRVYPTDFAPGTPSAPATGVDGGDLYSGSVNAGGQGYTQQ